MQAVAAVAAVVVAVAVAVAAAVAAAALAAAEEVAVEVPATDRCSFALTDIVLLLLLPVVLSALLGSWKCCNWCR